MSLHDIGIKHFDISTVSDLNAHTHKDLLSRTGISTKNFLTKYLRPSERNDGDVFYGDYNNHFGDGGILALSSFFKKAYAGVTKDSMSTDSAHARVLTSDELDGSPGIGVDNPDKESLSTFIKYAREDIALLAEAFQGILDLQ